MRMGFGIVMKITPVRTEALLEAQYIWMILLQRNDGCNILAVVLNSLTTSSWDDKVMLSSNIDDRIPQQYLPSSRMCVSRMCVQVMKATTHLAFTKWVVPLNVSCRMSPTLGVEAFYIGRGLHHCCNSLPCQSAHPSGVVDGEGPIT